MDGYRVRKIAIQLAGLLMGVVIALVFLHH